MMPIVPVRANDYSRHMIIVEFHIPGYPGPSQEHGTEARHLRGKILSRQNTNVLTASCCPQHRRARRPDKYFCEVGNE